jgi:hypothetical protein
MFLKENALDFNKYNPLKEQKPPLNDWTESVPVILLSEYLKQQSNAGIKLCHDNGVPCLSFNPGLTNKDRENGRWHIAEIAEGLLIDAAADLTELITNGKLSPPIKQRVLPIDGVFTGNSNHTLSTYLNKKGICKNAER